MVDKTAYLLELSRYIVRNPVAAGVVDDAAAWRWSSYGATAGLEKVPQFLEVKWLLAQFGSDLNRARAAYRQFVSKRDGLSPWDELSGADVLGDDAFRSALQRFKAEAGREIPKQKRVLRHLPLVEIEAQHSSRGSWMREAYLEHGYTMQAIADYAGVHHSTVSRLIRSKRENARSKT